MKCPNCNREIPSDSKFCPDCGNPLESILDTNIVEEDWIRCSNGDVVFGCTSINEIKPYSCDVIKYGQLAHNNSVAQIRDQYDVDNHECECGIAVFSTYPTANIVYGVYCSGGMREIYLPIAFEKIGYSENWSNEDLLSKLKLNGFLSVQKENGFEAYSKTRNESYIQISVYEEDIQVRLVSIEDLMESLKDEEL